MNRWDPLIKRLPRDRPVIGAEVGVFKGELSSALLSALPNLTLYMVDRWKPYSPGEWLKAGPIATARKEEFDAWQKIARKDVRPFGDRAIIKVGESMEVARKFPPRFFDFVFLDAGHTPKAVDGDIQAWSAHLKPGGLLCGHDYNPQKHPGVVEAVDRRFAGQAKIDDNATWFVRPAPPEKYISAFREVMGRDPDIANPQTHSEYFMRKMLTEDTDLMMQTADKVRVLDYVKEKIGEKYCRPLLYHGPVPKNIFSCRGNGTGGCAIKVNNAAGKNIFVLPDRNFGFFGRQKLGAEKIGKLLSAWMQEKYLRGGLHYYRIEPQVLVEPLFSDGPHDIHKIHTWGGKPRVIHSTRYDVSSGVLGIHGITWHDLGWKPLDLINRNYPHADFERPAALPEILEATAALAKPFDHARVDWYVRDDAILLNEMTHCSGGGNPRNLYPLKWQYEFGRIWKENSP